MLLYSGTLNKLLENSIKSERSRLWDKLEKTGFLTPQEKEQLQKLLKSK